ncbi:MAG: hypothetical protein CM1200mP10_09660 [Candidatus Neomarinimicrobiota bacterium]|nr:MAG: hypothetical protein CM1200mP10_09660 [Candidatus Neomarinimicrobiota bacterium]
MGSYDRDLAFVKQAENVFIDSVALGKGIFEKIPTKEKNNEGPGNIKEMDKIGRKFRPQGTI